MVTTLLTLGSYSYRAVVSLPNQPAPILQCEQRWEESISWPGDDEGQCWPQATTWLVLLSLKPGDEAQFAKHSILCSRVAQHDWRASQVLPLCQLRVGSLGYKKGSPSPGKTPTAALLN